MARYFCPRGRSFALSLCPGVGNSLFQKIPQRFAGGGGGEGEMVRLGIVKDKHVFSYCLENTKHTHHSKVKEFKLNFLLLLGRYNIKLNFLLLLGRYNIKKIWFPYVSLDDELLN